MKKTLAILKQGPAAWIEWRKKHPDKPDLIEAGLHGADLIKADLRGADLRGADLSESNLRSAYSPMFSASQSSMVAAIRGISCDSV